MKHLLDLAAFFATEAPRLQRFLRRHWPWLPAEDLAQDAFEKILAYDADAVRSPRGLLYRTARNLAINAGKREACVDIALVGDASALPFATDAPDPEQQVLARDMLVHLYVALHELPERQRVAIVLFKLEGCSYKTIGRRLRVSPRTVERYVAEGLATVSAAFRAKMAEPNL